MEMNSPIADWEWYRAWWNAFGGGARLRILAFEAAEEVVGIAPLYERTHQVGPLSINSLAPLGWEDGGNQPVTEHIELFFPSAWRGRLFDALDEWLRTSRWAVAWLPNLRRDDRLPAWTGRHVVARCAPIEHHHRPLPPTWDEFVAGLNKSMRDNVKYYPRLMVRHGHPYTFEVAETPESVRAVYPLLLDLHERRSQVQTGVQHWNYLGIAARRDFVGERIEQLAASGEARIGVLRVKDEPVAAYLWLERGDTMFMYRSGYEPSWSKYSVALVVALEAMKHCLARGLTHIEFLRGGGQLKERWDTEARPLQHVMLARAPRLARPLIAARARLVPTTYQITG